VDKDSISQVLGVLTDKRSRELLYIISIDKSPSLGLQKKIHLSKKEFYSRTGKMLGNGLIRRNKGRFAVTTMGRATLQPVAETGKAMEMNWKFRAIDAIYQTTGLRHDARLELIHSILGVS
jgi:predicted transcriptional regulator